MDRETLFAGGRSVEPKYPETASWGMMLRMALSTATIKHLSALRDELPHEAAFPEFQFQDTEEFRETCLAVLLNREKAFQIPTSGSDGKLSDPVFWICRPIGVLRREPFVVMHMAVQHNVCVEGI